MTMKDTQAPTTAALVLFADIIDSSIYSSILGVKQYAESLHRFQHIFKTVAKKYFQSPSLHNTRSWIDAKGDEGTVFCATVDPRGAGELVYTAIKFSFELKALLELVMKPKEKTQQVMHKMKLGIGIHFGEVATVRPDGTVERTETLAKIDHLEGYTINYGKRVESGSRAGKFSKVFLSKAAYSYIGDYPVVVEHHTKDLVGISKGEDLYEIRSAYLRDLALDYPPQIVKEFFENYVVDYLKLDFIDEPWLKSYVMSVLNAVIHNEKLVHIQKKYVKRQTELAWHNRVEDDPILLFMRAVEYKNEGRLTARVRILKGIVDKYPTFLFAQKELVRAYADLIDTAVIPAELVYARDMAQEFLYKFKNCLDTEEINEYESLIEKISPKLSAWKQQKDKKGESA